MIDKHVYYQLIYGYFLCLFLFKLDCMQDRTSELKTK